MNFGERIKMRRQDLGISADELGKMIGKNRATIYRYEKGDIESVPISVLEPLALALDTTPTWLLDWEPTKRDPLDIEYIGSIGKVIKSLRMLRHLSLTEFSVETGISIDELKRYEAGKVRIPEDKMEVMSRFLNVTVEDLAKSDVTMEHPHVAYISNSELRIRQLDRWYKALKGSDFTDEELDKMIEYGKFILFLRNE